MADKVDKTVTTDVELKKLNRAELLSMLLSMTEKCEDLEKQLEETRADLNKRNLEVSNAGSLAEAAMRINKVFEAADQASAQYLENIKKLGQDSLGGAAPVGASIDNNAVELTKKRCNEIEEETRRRCNEMIEKAKQDSQIYWDEVYDRIKQYTQVVDK